MYTADGKDKMSMFWLLGGVSRFLVVAACIGKLNAYHGSSNLDSGASVLVPATISVYNGIATDLFPSLKH